jgi:hypothetical protein
MAGDLDILLLQNGKVWLQKYVDIENTSATEEQNINRAEQIDPGSGISNTSHCK